VFPDSSRISALDSKCPSLFGETLNRESLFSTIRLFFNEIVEEVISRKDFIGVLLLDIRFDFRLQLITTIRQGADLSTQLLQAQQEAALPLQRGDIGSKRYHLVSNLLVLAEHVSNAQEGQTLRASLAKRIHFSIDSLEVRLYFDSLFLQVSAPLVCDGPVERNQLLEILLDLILKENSRFLE
jgi:hypothetical protein